MFHQDNVNCGLYMLINAYLVLHNMPLAVASQIDLKIFRSLTLLHISEKGMKDHPYYNYSPEIYLENENENENGNESLKA